MKKCFGMKSKKQQQNQKHSTLIQESQFKRPKNNKSSIKDRSVTTTINSNKNIVNLSTVSSSQNHIKDLSHDNELPPVSKRISKNRSLPERTEQNLPVTVSRSTSSLLAANNKDKSKSHTNSISSQNEAFDLNITQGFSSKPKLPPILNGSSSSSSHHQHNSNRSPTRHIPGVCGLKNIGNTCFMNSAIQCLSSIPDLTEWAMQQQTSAIDKNVIDVYISLLQEMWSGHYEYVNPTKLKEYVGRLAPMFSDYDQHDSHEFMNTLLNGIEAVGSDPFIMNLFRINTQSKTTCSKHQHIDIINELTTFLPIPLSNRKSYDHTNIFLEDLIKDFCQEDDLNGTYYCHKCNEYMSARQKTKVIQPLPRVLIIQLKRFPFDGTNRKINTLVQYKLVQENLLSNNDKYKLCAVSLHSGNLSGGHYTAMAQNYFTKSWYRFDDSHVEEIDIKNVSAPFFARQAYVLIYLKQNQ